MRWKLLFAGFALVGACQAAQAGYIDSEGKDWLALDPTMGASWSEIAAACDPISGVCDGVFSGPYFAPFNVTGYTWATADEVRDLFIELGDLPAGTLDSYDVQYQTTGNAELAFDKFGYTESTLSFKVAAGVTRTTIDKSSPISPMSAYIGFIFGPNLASPNPGSSEYFSLESWPTSFYDVSFGAFLYRTPAYAVPEPSTPALMVAGLIAAVLCRRGRRRLERG